MSREAKVPKILRKYLIFIRDIVRLLKRTEFCLGHLELVRAIL